MDKTPSTGKAVERQLGIFITTFIICTAGLWLSGDWLVLFTALSEKRNTTFSLFEWNHEVAKDITRNVLWSIVPTLTIYWAFCAFLKWKYYYRQKDTPEVWKCQPRKFLSEEDERNEIWLGLLSLSIASVLTGLISWHIESGGHNTIYLNVGDYGWPYLFISSAIHFTLMDFFLYWAHRIYHYPLFYRMIHKYHHRYVQPTPYSFSAMHPIEMLTYQSITLAPIFIFPVYWGWVLIICCYSFYYGVLDHSGIKFEPMWPWQHPTTFHDNHHQYFHCNFGIHTDWYDKLFGTVRVKDRVYNETIFYGAGKSVKDASAEEITEHQDNIKDD